MKQQIITINILILLLIVGTSLVSGFNVQIDAKENSVLPRESATYDVTITGTETNNEVISIHVDAKNWIITPQSVAAPANETTTFALTITPRSSVGISNYRIPVRFEAARSEEVVEQSVFLSISLELLAKGYSPNLKLEVDSPADVDPRQPMETSIFIRNNNLRTYDNLTIMVSSDLFSETINAPLGPQSTYRKKFLFNLDRYEEPGAHELRVIVALPGGETLIAEDYSAFEIRSYSQLVSDRKITERKFLGIISKEVITLTNEGNKELNKQVSYEVSAWEDMFLKASEKGIITKEDKRKITWDISLEPQETQEITLTRNYLPLIIAITLFLLAIISYFVFRSPIIALKEAQITVADKQGINKMKVRLFVKNRSRYTVNKLKIIDRVPHIAEFIPHDHLGTLQPSKVTKSEKRGTLIRWEIDSLEPYEERIISYNIKSKLKIVGGMSLPETRIKFEARKGHERITSSGQTKMYKKH